MQTKSSNIMEEKSVSTSPVITLEEISRRKKEVKKQIEIQKVLMTSTASELFSPTKATNKMEFFMNSFNSGMAVFDGVMTGLKIMRRIRLLFKKKK